MFIQTEDTPNPATLKFIPGQPVMAQGTAQFNTPESAAASPLAKRLLQMEGISAVFLGRDFLSVTKTPDADWDILRTRILGEIMQYVTSGLPIYQGSGTDDDAPHADNAEDDEIVTQIKELLDTRVRPAVAHDGGDITFVRFEEGVVYLRMQGACAGCPSSTATLKMGIENMMRHYIPEVLAVEPEAEDYGW